MAQESPCLMIVAIRGERGSYNIKRNNIIFLFIVAIRGERGSYNRQFGDRLAAGIVAIRGERGSYNACCRTGREA